MGKVLTGIGIVGIIGILVLFFMAGESPATAGSRFMAELQTGDADTLTNMSYVAGKSHDQIESEWKDTVKYGQYYKWKWAVDGADTIRDDQAKVRMRLMRNIQNNTSYDENYYLPLVKKDGKWMVDVIALNRGIYPFLPRG